MLVHLVKENTKSWIILEDKEVIQKYMIVCSNKHNPGWRCSLMVDLPAHGVRWVLSQALPENKQKGH